MSGPWTVRLSASAERDYVAILRWTRQHFGPLQARTYAATLQAAQTELCEGPLLPGSGSADEIEPGLRLLHVARHGRNGRHIVFYRADAEDTRIIVARLLHDSMDLPRHLHHADD